MLSPITLLVLINCLPFYFILAFGWDAGALVRIYWAENIVIGFYYILKLICVRVHPPAANIGKLLMVPFFLVHFGGFCAVHGIFVFALTSGGQEVNSVMGPASFGPWWGPFIFVGLLVQAIKYFLHNASFDELFMFQALFVSHGFSFYINFIRAGEWKVQNISELMTAPYRRIVLLHVVILAGALPVMLFKSPMPLVLLLVIIKIMMDIKLHRTSHAETKRTKKASITSQNQMS